MTMSQDVVHWPIDQPSIEGSGIDVAEAHSNHATPWKTSCGFLVAIRLLVVSYVFASGESMATLLGVCNLQKDLLLSVPLR